MKRKLKLISIFLILVAIILGCARPLHRHHYILNYVPGFFEKRGGKSYPKTIRLRPLEIEKLYARPNIVYRENPFKVDFYPDHLWAVRPADMITDLIFNHLESVRLVETLVRRLDEKGTPDYELSGTIFAIEEYNSSDLWYAHLRISMVLTDFRTGRAVYSRMFSLTREVTTKTPLAVVKALSEIIDFIVSSLVVDLDHFLYNETRSNVSNAEAENFED
jgi:ABC-type uncharacterized transport system auxiliary subunit